MRTPSAIAVLCSLTFVACSDDPDKDTVDTHADTADTTDAVDSDDADTNDTDTDTADTDSDVPQDVDTTDTTDTRDVPDIPPGVWPWPAETITVPASPSWRATLSYPSDPFAANAPIWDRPAARWVKFLIFTGDPSRVYFQDTIALPTHHAFASTLKPFSEMTQADLDRVTLDNSSEKKAILGAVLLPSLFGQRDGALPLREVGVQLLGHEPYSLHVARTVLDLIRDHITVDDGGAAPKVFYFPTPEQYETARADADLFDALGHPVDSARRWDRAPTCHTAGWTVGRLVVDDEHAHIEEAFTARTAAPAWFQALGGLLTFGPANPASRDAQLARTFGVPLIHVGPPNERERVRSLANHLVALRAESAWDGGCNVSLLDLEGHLDTAGLAEILTLRPSAPRPLAVETSDTIALTATLTRSSRAQYGALATNLGLLTRTLPNHAPTPSLSVPFGPFIRHLTPLRTEIAARLAGHTWPPADLAALEADLADVRRLVIDTPIDDTFDALTNAFPSNEPIVLRPSTNFTDLDDFAGAGFHADQLACLGDTPETTTSACGLPEPRPLLDALRALYAELWTAPSYAYRKRHGIADTAVAMAVVVQPARPAVLAHGRVNASDAGAGARRHDILVQPPRIPLDHPHAEPERATANVFTFGTYTDLGQYGAAVEIGTHTMSWEADYTALSALVAQLQTPWRDDVATPQGQLLTTVDFALLDTPPPRFSIDRIAAQPRPSDAQKVTPYLLPGPAITRCIFQGEAGALLGNHRLKARVTLEHDAGWLDDAMFATTFYDRLDIVRATPAASFTGNPTTFPGAYHRAPIVDQWGQASPVIDGWTQGNGPDRITWELGTSLPVNVTPAQLPLLSLGDHFITLTATYTTAQPEPGQWPDGTTTLDVIQLAACPEDEVLTPDHIQVTRNGRAGSIGIDIRFYWPPAPTGVTAGYTAPLAKWDTTTITGLTTTPLVLRGYWSQTYRPGHHNFSEEFLFEPRLEEGIDPALVAELNTKDIAALIVSTDFDGFNVWAIGLNGKIRQLAGGQER